MLGQEKSSEYVLAELFGEADALDFGKGLFESEPTFGYLDPFLMIPAPPPPPPPPPPPLPPLPSMVRCQSLDDLKNLEELEPLGLDSGVHSKCPTPVPVDLRQVSMEMPMYLMQEDEGNDEEIMRLLGVSNSSPSTSNLSESSSDSGNASVMQLSDSLSGDQLGGECGGYPGGRTELAGGCGSDSGAGIMDVLDGQFCSPEVLEQLMFMDIDCVEARDDIRPRSLEELVSQVATGAINQLTSADNATPPIMADSVSGHPRQSEGDRVSKTVLQMGEGQCVGVSSRAGLCLPVRQTSPPSDQGSVEALSSSSSEPGTSPAITPSGSSALASTDRGSLPDQLTMLPAFPTYSVEVPRVDLTSSGPERAVLTLQATPILSVKHTAGASQGHHHKSLAVRKSRLPGGWPKGKKRKTEKELLKPPKPPITSYRAFLRDKQPSLMAQGEHGSMQKVSKKLGKMWGSLCAEDRAEYVRQAEEDRNRYVSELKEYMQRALEETSPSQEVLHMLITDMFREADNDELYCHICQLSFTNTSNKQAHFCGRLHSAEIIKKLFSVLGCANHSRRGKRRKAIREPNGTCGLVSHTSPTVSVESGVPLQVDVTRESAKVPVPPPVPSLRSRVKDTSTSSAISGSSLRDKFVSQPLFSYPTPSDQAVVDDLGSLMNTVVSHGNAPISHGNTSVSHGNTPSGETIELSCLATGSSDACVTTDSNPSGTAPLHLSLMDIVSVTDQLLLEGLAHVSELAAVERDDHPSQSLAGLTLSP